MRIVFAGTPEFALPGLEQILASDQQLVGVYTQPDRRAGRGQGMLASPVKQRAQAAGIAVYQPISLRDPAAQQQLAELAPDLMVVIAYGLILPQAVLDTPTYGCWNIHASLLPRWRGAAPIQRAIEAGDSHSGVCLMQMNAGLDTGPVIARSEIALSEQETAASLHDRLAALGGELLAAWIPQLAAGEDIELHEQDHDQACYARKLEKSEALLGFDQSALDLARKVRAFNPWPGARCEIAGEMVRVWSAHALAQGEGIEKDPGSLVAAGAQGLDLACATGVLRITELQRPGGRRISAADYLNARQELRT